MLPPLSRQTIQDGGEPKLRSDFHLSTEQSNSCQSHQLLYSPKIVH